MSVQSFSNTSPNGGMTPYVDHENDDELVIILRKSEFDVVNVDSPEAHVSSKTHEIYANTTRDALENDYGLGIIEQGETFPNADGSGTTTTQKGWKLVEVEPTAYSPSFSEDDSQTPYKYDYITLIYQKSDAILSPKLLPGEFGGGRGGRSGGAGANGSWQPLPSPPYASNHVWGSPCHKYSAGNCWKGIIVSIYNGIPEPHKRIMLEPEWDILLTAYPDLPEPYHDFFQHDVMDCFRPSTPEDGAPWWTKEKVSLISRGINNSWYDTHLELVNNRGNPFNFLMRAWHWLSIINIENRYWDTQGEEHVDVKVRCPSLQRPIGKVYRHWTAPRFPLFPIASLRGLLSGESILGIRTYADEDSDEDDY